MAIYNNRIIVAGENSSEALQKALQRHPELKPEQIEIDYIQIADELILLNDIYSSIRQNQHNATP